MMFVPWISNDQSPITISFLTSKPNARLTSPPEGTLFHLFFKNWRKFICHVIRDNLSLSETTDPPPFFASISKHYTFQFWLLKASESTLFCLHCSYLVTCSWTPAINIFSSIFLPLPLSFPAPLHELSPSQSFQSTNGGFKTIPISSSKELF